MDADMPPAAYLSIDADFEAERRVLFISSNFFLMLLGLYLGELKFFELSAAFTLHQESVAVKGNI